RLRFGLENEGAGAFHAGGFRHGGQGPPVPDVGVDVVVGHEGRRRGLVGPHDAGDADSAVGPALGPRGRRLEVVGDEAAVDEDRGVAHVERGDELPAHFAVDGGEHEQFVVVREVAGGGGANELDVLAGGGARL